VAIGTEAHGETPNSWPTPATPANSVSSAPIAETNSVPADSSAHQRLNLDLIRAPWPWRVTIPRRIVISCTTYRMGIRITWGRIIL